MSKFGKQVGKIMAKNLQREIPLDQVWVSCPEFEKKLYRKDVSFPEAKAITAGPKHHWFSYYDKFQTDPSDRFALSMEVDFDDRSPGGNDYINVGMIDLENGNQWIELGNTCAWCWQQGCMLQWRPCSTVEVMWNDRIENNFVCHILNVETGAKRTLEYPIYHVHPNGRLALVADFARLQSVRPGYGYPGVRDVNEDILRPKDSGVSVMDIDTGDIRLLISVKDIAALQYQDEVSDDDKHYFNALAWNPDGSRFLFLHRWRSLKGRFSDFRTRMFTAATDGSDIRMVTNKPYISHFTWRDQEHIAMWRENGYVLYMDDGSMIEQQTILEATNGHLSFLPGNEWMIADTYVDKDRCQNLFLYHLETGKIVPLGHFKTLRHTTGELRCDLHPRITRDGQSILIDSTHGGNRRQMYLINIGNIIKR